MYTDPTGHYTQGNLLSYEPGGIYGDGVLIVADKEKLIAASRRDREIYGFTLNLSVAIIVQQ